MKYVFLVNVFLLLAVIVNHCIAQSPLVTPATDTSRIVNIRDADRLRYKKTDSTNEFLMAAGNVFFQDNQTLFYADSAVHNKNLNIIEAFGNVRINDNDSVHTRSQYLVYYVNTKQALLKKSKHDRWKGNPHHRRPYLRYTT